MKTAEQIMGLATILGDRRLLATKGMNSRDDVAEAHEALRTAIEELAADAARYRWLHYNGLKLSFSHELIGLLLSNKTELDAAMKEST